MLKQKHVLRGRCKTVVPCQNMQHHGKTFPDTSFAFWICPSESSLTCGPKLVLRSTLHPCDQASTHHIPWSSLLHLLNGSSSSEGVHTTEWSRVVPHAMHIPCSGGIGKPNWLTGPSTHPEYRVASTWTGQGCKADLKPDSSQNAAPSDPRSPKCAVFGPRFRLVSGLSLH